MTILDKIFDQKTYTPNNVISNINASTEICRETEGLSGKTPGSWVVRAGGRRPE